MPLFTVLLKGRVVAIRDASCRNTMRDDEVSLGPDQFKEAQESSFKYMSRLLQHSMTHLRARCSRNRGIAKHLREGRRGGRRAVRAQQHEARRRGGGRGATELLLAAAQGPRAVHF